MPHIFFFSPGPNSDPYTFLDFSLIFFPFIWRIYRLFILVYAIWIPGWPVWAYLHVFRGYCTMQSMDWYRNIPDNRISAQIPAGTDRSPRNGFTILSSRIFPMALVATYPVYWAISSRKA